VFLQLNPEVIRPGTGSGFLWDAQHVVTNYHVVQSAHRVKVTLSNQLTYDASVVGTDASNDLAVLKLSSAPLDVRPISVGTSHDLMVGQRVFAIGNPFGLDQTLTGASCANAKRTQFMKTLTEYKPRPGCS
jgi:S1-C subfamily serine protease